MTKDEALKLSLEALKRATNYDPLIARAITAIKEALAQPEQEPAFYAHDGYLMTPERAKFLGFPLDSILALYTTPPQRTWVGLTDEEVRKICVNEWGGYEQCRAIEAKLKELNDHSI